MKFQHAALPALLFVVGACNENEETITVREDGSATVELSVNGDANDVADGYSIPLQAPWIADSEATREWLKLVGPDTGAAANRTRLAALDPSSKVFSEKDKVALSVHADFASLAELPRFYAPPSEPYADAFLDHKTSLTVRQEGSRRVFVFERRYGAREFERFDVWTQVQNEIGEDEAKKLDGTHPIEHSLRERVIDAATGSLLRSLSNFADDALTPLFTEGRAELSAASAVRVRGAVRSAIAREVSREHVAQLVAKILPENGVTNGTEDDELSSFEASTRDLLRRTLESALAAEGVGASTRNAVRGELEWRFTHLDHTTDLGDDKFELTVKLPGTIVGGNADSIDGSTAIWKFEGQTLRDRERVLTAVSVLE